MFNININTLIDNSYKADEFGDTCKSDENEPPRKKRKISKDSSIESIYQSIDQFKKSKDVDVYQYYKSQCKKEIIKLNNCDARQFFKNTSKEFWQNIFAIQNQARVAGKQIHIQQILNECWDEVQNEVQNEVEAEKDI